MPEETKKPIYMQKKEHWTMLLIKEFHERLFHAGTSHTLSQMRYINWIPQGQATVKAYINVVYAESTMVDYTRCRK